MGYKIMRSGRAKPIGNHKDLEVESNILQTAVYGTQFSQKIKEIEVSTTGGANTVTVTGAIPAGAIVFGVAGKVTTILAGSGGLATFSVGVSGAATRYGTGLAKAAGTTFGPEAALANEFPRIYGSATDIVLTANGAETFASGKLRLAIAYWSVTPPTS